MTLSLLSWMMQGGSVTRVREWGKKTLRIDIRLLPFN